MDFYPRPPRGGRHVSPDILQHLVNISIHVLREEDDGEIIEEGRSHDISIHVLREEDDSVRAGEAGRRLKFLSTSSARRTTTRGSTAARLCRYFYPRPPRGGRHVVTAAMLGRYAFLSTSSARRTTAIKPSSSVAPIVFLSTSSARRTTSTSPTDTSSST